MPLRATRPRHQTQVLWPTLSSAWWFGSSQRLPAAEFADEFGPLGFGLAASKFPSPVLAIPQDLVLAMHKAILAPVPPGPEEAAEAFLWPFAWVHGAKRTN